MTYSTKDKEMINTNKAVQVKFSADTSIASANIYIPFPVTEMHVRAVDIYWEADYVAVAFTSNLVNDGPLGGSFCGLNYDNSTATKKIRYLFPEPKDINGTYTFSYTVIDPKRVLDGLVLFPSVNYGYVCFSLNSLDMFKMFFLIIKNMIIKKLA